MMKMRSEESAFRVEDVMEDVVEDVMRVGSSWTPEKKRSRFRRAGELSVWRSAEPGPSLPGRSVVSGCRIPAFGKSAASLY